MIKVQSSVDECSNCGSDKNVTDYTFNADGTFRTNVSLCLGCRKKMAELLKED